MQPSQNDQLPDINTIPGPEPLNNAPVFKDTPEKKSHAMLYGMILLAILAAGGIGFGVWAMLDGNQKTTELNEQITDLKKQLAEKQPTTNNNGDDIDTSSTNLIISPQNGGTYGWTFLSEKETIGLSSTGAESNRALRISVQNGNISNCEISYSDGNTEACEINGLSGEIYDIREFNAPVEGSPAYVGFILTDGTVEYLPISAMESKDFTVKKINLDGEVINIKTVNNEGRIVTVFVLNDGSIVELDESMF